MRLFSSLFIFFFFFDQQQQSKNKGDLNADELPALFVHAHCTHTAAFSSSGCLDHTNAPPPEQSRSRSEISRIRADGRRDQRTEPWPHAHDVWLLFVVSTLKPEEKIQAAAAALTGWEAVVCEW